MTFKQQVYIILIDKLTIGLLIVLAGYLFNKSLEGVKHQLQVIAKEREIRFNKLHEKRVEVIGSLYSLFQATRESAALFSEVVPQDAQATSVDILKKWNELHVFYRKNRIYLSEELSDQIKRFFRTIEKPAKEFATIPEKQKADFTIVLKSLLKEAESKKILELIEWEFRRVLGSSRDLHKQLIHPLRVLGSQEASSGVN